MNSRAKVRSARGWDVGLAAAIAAVVLLGWLTAPGSNGAAPHSGQLVSPARPSGQARPLRLPGHRLGSINDPPGLPHQ
jgi:hypothetical protein